MSSLTEQWRQERESARQAVAAAEQTFGSNPGSEAARRELGQAQERLRDAMRHHNDLEFNDRLQASNAAAAAKAEASAVAEAERVAALPKRVHTVGAIRPVHAEDSHAPPATKPLKI